MAYSSPRLSVHGKKVDPKNTLCAGIVGADPVHLAVCRSDLLLCLRVQAGKCAALPSGGGRAYHLFREERNYPLGDCASHKPPGIADAGGLDVIAAKSRRT